MPYFISTYGSTQKQVVIVLITVPRNTVDEPERKLLLKMADLEDALWEEACLNSFISGYRLAQGIQQELLADHPPYNFENEDEQRACELAGKER